MLSVFAILAPIGEYPKICLYCIFSLSNISQICLYNIYIYIRHLNDERTWEQKWALDIQIGWLSYFDYWVKIYQAYVCVHVYAFIYI